MSERVPDPTLYRILDRHHRAVRRALVTRHGLRGAAAACALVALALAIGVALPLGPEAAWARLLVTLAGIGLAVAAAVRAFRGAMPGFDAWQEGIERHFPELPALGCEYPPRAVIGRPLDEHAARPQRGENEVESLQRAVRHDDTLGKDAVPLADPLAQRLVAERAPVREDRSAVAAQRLACAIGQLLDRQALRRRNASCERDRHAPTVAVAAARSATSVGVVPTWTPRASSASFFAWAVPDEPEMIAPAWPIVLPGGAVKPAM